MERMFKRLRTFIQRLSGKYYLPTTEVHSGVPAKTQKETYEKQKPKSKFSSLIEKIKRFFS
jgi:hypothetical protein